MRLHGDETAQTSLYGVDEEARPLVAGIQLSSGGRGVIGHEVGTQGDLKDALQCRQLYGGLKSQHFHPGLLPH